VTLFLYNDFFIFSNASLQIEKHFHETHNHFLIYTKLRSFVLSIICFLDKSFTSRFFNFAGTEEEILSPPPPDEKMELLNDRQQSMFFCSSGFCWQLERTFSYTLIVF